VLHLPCLEIHGVSCACSNAFEEHCRWIDHHDVVGRAQGIYLMKTFLPPVKFVGLNESVVATWSMLTLFQGGGKFAPGRYGFKGHGLY
jgi:hypothetical protein